MAQQTGVEFLEKQLTLALGDELKPLRGLFVVAKEMDREHIINAVKSQCIFTNTQEIAERYYNETYGKQ